MITRPYSCGGMDDDRFMGKTSFRLIRNHPNDAVRAAVKKALIVAGRDSKSQEALPNEVVLYPSRTDSKELREIHLAAYEAYAVAIRPTFPGMAAQMMAEVLTLQSAPALGAAPLVPVEATPALPRDRHGVPTDPTARDDEMQTGERSAPAGVDRHGFMTEAGKVRDWASEQAAAQALAEAPPATEARETAESGPVEEVVRAPRAKRVVRLHKEGRAPAPHKADVQEE